MTCDMCMGDGPTCGLVNMLRNQVGYLDDSSVLEPFSKQGITAAINNFAARLEFCEHPEQLQAAIDEAREKVEKHVF